MKLLIFSGLFLATVLASANEAQIGIVLGSTTGLSGKIDIGGNRSIDGVLAYSTDSKYGNYFHIDYLIEKARNFAIRDELSAAVGSHAGTRPMGDQYPKSPIKPRNRST